MLNEWLVQILSRDLLKLKEELSSYSDEAHLWKLSESISNTAGNLALHLVGNLNHFIGATLGNTGYIRNRDAEFILKDVPRHNILADIDALLPVIQQTLSQLTVDDFEKEYPLEIAGRRVSTGQFMLHLTAHLAYHLGQINYHRRLIAA